MSKMMKSEKKALVPRLRFPEFRDAGEWEEMPLGTQGNFISSLTGKSAKDFDSGNAKFIPYMNVFSNTFIDVRDLRAVNLTEGESQNPVIKGDVFFTVSSETPEEAGMSSILLDEINNCYVNSFCAIFRFDNNRLPNPVFLGYWLRSGLVREYLSKNAQGATRYNISKPVFRELPLFLPSPPEQQKIADCLSSIDALITAQAEKLDALKTHKKGLMQQLFSREGEPVPRLRFPEFRATGEWKERLFSELVESLDAGVSVNSGDRPANTNEKGILKTSAVSDGVFDPMENKVVSELEELKRLKEPVTGDTIVISRMNTPALVGANAYVERDRANLFLPDRLWAAKPKAGTSARFIAYILGSGKGRTALSALATGTSGSMKNITKTRVFELQFMTPDTEEQQKIADCLSSLDALIAAQAEKLDALKTHKKGLLQQLFPAIEEVSC